MTHAPETGAKNWLPSGADFPRRFFGPYTVRPEYVTESDEPAAIIISGHCSQT